MNTKNDDQGPDCNVCGDYGCEECKPETATNDPIASIDFRPLSGPVIVWHKPPHKIGIYEVYATDPNGRPQGAQSPRIEDRAAVDVELLPCPFCGMAGSYEDIHRDGRFYQITCAGCWAGSHTADSMEEVVRSWNRRASATPSVAVGEGAFPAVYIGEVGGKRVGLHGSIESVQALYDYLDVTPKTTHMVVSDLTARQIGDEYFTQLHKHGKASMQNAFWTEHLRVAVMNVLIGSYDGPHKNTTPTKPGHMVDDDVAKDAARYRFLRIKGAAFDGDPKDHLGNGLVMRVCILDDAIDAMLNATQGGKGEGE